MTLTKEQIDFGSAKNTTVTDTASNLMNFFKPIDEEGTNLKNFKSSSLGSIDGCGVTLSFGCISGIIFGLIIVGINGLVGLMGDRAVNTCCSMFVISSIEFAIINYIYNKMYVSKHKGAPEDPDRLSGLIMPLISFLSQDMKDDEQITVKSALLPLESDNFEKSDKEIKQMGKTPKRGLSVYAGDLLELTTRFADGTAASFNVNEVVSTVYVFKKHGADKNSRKEKITIKAAFAFPANSYGDTKEGEYDVDENTTAVVTTSERRVKVVVKKVIEDASDTTFSIALTGNSDILNGCIDAMAAAYSIVG